MIKKQYIITGLDIGSEKIAGVVSRIDREGNIEILARQANQSDGVDHGVPVDLRKCVNSISKLFSGLVKKSRLGLGDIVVNISGQDVTGRYSKGMIPISLRGREIEESDIEKCVSAASTIHLPFDKEIIHRITHKFSIDDEPWIKDPLGLYASRLACEVYVITANINHIQTIYKCVNDAGYDVKDVVFTALADKAGLSVECSSDNYVIMVDIGSSLCEVSVFKDGILQEFDVIKITRRIIADNFRDNKDIDIITSGIDSAVKRVSKDVLKTPVIMITGGVSLTDGFIEYLEEKSGYQIKMPVVRDVKGDISGLDGVIFSTAIGLVKYSYQSRFPENKSISKSLAKKISSFLNDYF